MCNAYGGERLEIRGPGRQAYGRGGDRLAWRGAEPSGVRGSASARGSATDGAVAAPVSRARGTGTSGPHDDPVWPSPSRTPRVESSPLRCPLAPTPPSNSASAAAGNSLHSPLHAASPALALPITGWVGGRAVRLLLLLPLAFRFLSAPRPTAMAPALPHC